MIKCKKFILSSEHQHCSAACLLYGYSCCYCGSLEFHLPNSRFSFFYDCLVRFVAREQKSSSEQVWWWKNLTYIIAIHWSKNMYAYMYEEKNELFMNNFCFKIVKKKTSAATFAHFWHSFFTAMCTHIYRYSQRDASRVTKIELQLVFWQKGMTLWTIERYALKRKNQETWMTE